MTKENKMTTQTEALKMALAALESCVTELLCNNAHHATKDRHGFGDDCPVIKRHQEAITALKQALAAPTVQDPVAWVDSVMEQAQVFASAWSLVGSRFDGGNEMENAEEQKKALRAMLTTAPA